MVNFGYVSLFVVAFPIAPLVALVNFMVNIYMDSDKMLRLTSRPPPEGAQGNALFFHPFSHVYISYACNNGRAYVLLRVRVCADIGSWQYVFETISYVSVVSNLAIVCFTNKSPMFGYQLSFVDRLIFFIVAEHMVLFLKYALATYIPDEPFDTKLQLQRQSTYHYISHCHI